MSAPLAAYKHRDWKSLAVALELEWDARRPHIAFFSIDIGTFEPLTLSILASDGVARPEEVEALRTVVAQLIDLDQQAFDWSKDSNTELMSVSVRPETIDGNTFLEANLQYCSTRQNSSWGVYYKQDSKGWWTKYDAG